MNSGQAFYSLSVNEGVKRGNFMPYFTFKEIWTPLKMFKIRFFYETDQRSYWVKVGSKSRRQIF
jgi:hypothetical protein